MRGKELLRKYFLGDFFHRQVFRLSINPSEIIENLTVNILFNFFNLKKSSNILKFFHYPSAWLSLLYFIYDPG